jgi:Outer membrane protein beta-barrel domain
MSKRVCLFVCLVALSVLASASPAFADHGSVRLYGGLWLGFGGKAEVDYTGPLGIRASAPNDKQVTTVGGQVGVDVPVMRFLSLGAEARFGAFNSKYLHDNRVGRSKLIDLDFKPRLTFPLPRLPLELYFTTPIGLTIPVLADDFGNGSTVDAKPGWNLGIGAGLNFWLTRRVALNVEPNYLMHWFDLDLPVGSGSVKLQQFTLFFNVVVAL